jgi:ABC-type phosphonate transport system ATPase subunit
VPTATEFVIITSLVEISQSKLHQRSCAFSTCFTSMLNITNNTVNHKGLIFSNQT